MVSVSPDHHINATIKQVVKGYIKAIVSLSMEIQKGIRKYKIIGFLLF